MNYLLGFHFHLDETKPVTDCQEDDTTESGEDDVQLADEVERYVKIIPNEMPDPKT